MSKVFARVEDSQVVEIFEERPILHETLMAQLVHLDAAEVGDWVVGDVNIGPQPSDYHSLVDGAWVEDQESAQMAARAQSKFEGFSFENVQCSATGRDQNGLLAVAYSYNRSPDTFAPTRFKFANGQELVLTVDNFQTFEAAWTEFRNSFYEV